jgi:hypothetical protein
VAVLCAVTRESAARSATRRKNLSSRAPPSSSAVNSTLTSTDRRNTPCAARGLGRGGGSLLCLNDLDIVQETIGWYCIGNSNVRTSHY